jgi:DNA invertase Pin-like site-specific DNA recombinase
MRSSPSSARSTVVPLEREIAGERIRDKIAASKKKGMWMGGNVPL